MTLCKYNKYTKLLKYSDMQQRDRRSVFVQNHDIHQDGRALLVIYKIYKHPQINKTNS